MFFFQVCFYPCSNWCRIHKEWRLYILNIGNTHIVYCLGTLMHCTLFSWKKCTLEHDLQNCLRQFRRNLWPCTIVNPRTNIWGPREPRIILKAAPTVGASVCRHNNIMFIGTLYRSHRGSFSIGKRHLVLKNVSWWF